MDIEEIIEVTKKPDQFGEIGIEKRIKVISKLIEFATYSNVGLYDQKRSEEEDLEVEGKKVELKGPVGLKKGKGGFKNNDTQALYNLDYSYKLFDAIEEFEGEDVDEYVSRATEKRFTGVFKVVKVEGDQCFIAEIIGLKRKLYYVMVEKELLDYIPSDFYEVNQLYFINDLVLNYARKERVIVFLIDQQTKGKFTPKIYSKEIKFIDKIV